MASGISPPPTFLACPGKPSIAWKQWIALFQNYMVASNGNSYGSGRKKALLLHCLGAEGQRLFYTLSEVSVTIDDSDNDCTKAMKMLELHFQPSVNVIAERYRFRKRAQLQGESIDEYLAALRELVTFCEFQNPDEMIRDQIVEKTCVNKIREKLLMESKLTLNKTLEISRQVEKALREAKCIKQEDNTVRYTKAKSSKPKKDGDTKVRLCYRCGSRNHLANDSACKAKSVICRKCKKKGHFEKVCKSTVVQQISDADCITEDNQVSEDLILGISNGSENCFKAKVTVNDINMSLIIDSGSPVTLISSETYHRYFGNQKLHKAKLNLTSYSKNHISLLGTFTAKVSYGGKTSDIKVYVTEEGTSLLGRDAMAALELKLDGADMSVMHTENSLPIVKSLGAEFTKYSPCFEPVDGTTVKGFVHKVKLKSDVKPVQQKMRRLPFAIRQDVSDELKRLEKEGIIERIDSSEFISPLVVVRKKNKKLRLCVDLRKVNESVVIDRFPLPTVDEIFSEMHGAKYFSRLDAANAYHQLKLHEESRDLTAFNSHEGIFRFTRACFGLASSPSAFQKMMSNLLCGMKGAKCILDDVIVWGKTKEDHDANLRKVLQKFLEVNLKLNDKCEFNMQQIEFFGHVLTADGLKPQTQLSKAIIDAPTPHDVTSLRSFLGLVGYYSKFCPDFATLVEPMRKLLRKDTSFVWDTEAQHSFDTVKNMIAHHITLSYYDPNLPTIITTDASGYGLGATLTQKDRNGCDVIVACASRTLSENEKKYSVGEREALACVWACEKFHNYVFGRKFELCTDHQALTSLLSSRGTGRRPMRIARWNARLLRYNYTIKYKPGEQNKFADALSRIPLNDVETPDEDDEIVCSFVSDENADLSMSLHELQSATHADKTLEKLKKYICDGWPHKKDCDQELQPFYHIRDELTIFKELIMRGERILVPQILTLKLINLAHMSHQGIVRTKQRLRDLYYWRGLDAQVEDAIHNCNVCNAHDKTAKTFFAPMKPIPLPKEPWEKLGIDIVGPNDNAPPECRFAITLIDYYSKWPEVMFTSKVAAAVIRFLKFVFSREGYCSEIVSDNGVQFCSREFEEFLCKRNIKHSYSSLYYPQACGEIERFNAVFGNSVKTALMTGRSIADAMREFLCIFRSTKHATTGHSPSVLLHGRQMRTGLDIPGIHGTVKNCSSEEVLEYVKQKQMASKAYTDDKRNAKQVDINVGDYVRIKKPGHVRKGESKYSDPVKITATHGPATYSTEDGRRWNQSKISPCVKPMEKKSMKKENDDTTSTSGNMSTTLDFPRRSRRIRNTPLWHKDYKM